MAGQDETQARAVLASMLDRIARGPNDALELPHEASPEDVRHAFLQLTKTFHPARFGRMAPDIQKLANEVFLALRAAHDTLARPTRGAASRQSGGIPVVTPPPQLRASSSGAMPPQRGGSGAYPVINPPGQRQPTPQRTAQLPLVGRTPAPQRTAPLPAVGRPRTGESQALAADRLRVPSAPPGGPATQRGFGATQRASSPGQPIAKPDLAVALELMIQGDWEQARATLNALIAVEPNVPKYPALIAYSRGREAQLAHRLDEARVELMNALQLDPELQLAKTALAELFTRRK